MSASKWLTFNDVDLVPRRSSYSSDALDFEMEHKLDPVFDSPRMSRRSLRLLTTAHATEDSLAADKGARTARQRRSANKPVLSIHHASRKALASATGQGFSSGVRPPVLDESLIREQTQVDHFWADVVAAGSRGVGGDAELLACVHSMFTLAFLGEIQGPD
ncbi:hypothetical protein CB1_000092013 [Camelus ferus]|nr:hypothetical protein CB1_002039002 [Camelus ferus]EPY89580.1 hypothetical protein CB1_000092013 [Camelus ferus]